MARPTVSQCSYPVRNILVACIAAAMGVTSVAQANTHTVNTTADAGPGSLRQAILDANADVMPPVVVDANVSGMITLTTGQLAITNGMSILGSGASSLAISRNPAYAASRIFYVHAPAQNVVISGLTLTGGYDTSGTGGAGILSKDTNLTLESSVVSGNGVMSVGTPKGGGIYVSGAGVQTTISNVTISNNDNAHGYGGGAFINAGPYAVVTISNSVISGNSGAHGGGIYATGTGGSIYLQSTQLLGNHAVFNEGGGLLGVFPSGVKKVSIIDSTVSGNNAHYSGGGISFYKLAGDVYINHTNFSANTTTLFTGGGLRVYASGASTATILNSTFSGNVAAGIGGGIALEGAVSTNISNTTVVANSASGNAGGVFSGVSDTNASTIESSTITNNSTANTGGGIFVASATPALVLHNTVVAGNAATSSDPDTAGSFSANFNLIQNPGDATITGSNNITGVDPLLGPLGNYGGSMQTKLPLPGSPLIDAGDPAATTLATDQRGLARVAGAFIDIGADERQTSEDTIFLDNFDGY